MFSSIRTTAAAVLFAIMAALTGCATNDVPRDVVTASGRPEVTITGADLDAIRSAIVDNMLKEKSGDGNRWTLESESPSLMTFVRASDGGAEAFAISLSLGNSYSTNSRLTRFNIIKAPGGFRVVADIMARAKLPGGTVNEGDYAGQINRIHNYWQNLLHNVKRDAELPAKT